MFTAFPVADPIQEKTLEDEHFNLKTLITVWYKHISPQASNRYNRVIIINSFLIILQAEFLR